MERHKTEQVVKFRARKFVNYMALYRTMVLNRRTYINTQEISLSPLLQTATTSHITVL